MGTISLRGHALVLLLFDVSEEIQIELLKDIVDSHRLQTGLKDTSAEYVKFEHPPAVERLETGATGGEAWDAEIKYYDYGVVSVLWRVPFTGDWASLQQLAIDWTSRTDFEQRSMEIIRQRLARTPQALVKPYPSWLTEDYLIFQISEIDRHPQAGELIASDGGRIAQIIRGESTPLSPGECSEILQSSISYGICDLVVTGWNAAFIYDSDPGAESTIQLLEYANSQLLEFRHYDELLTRELSRVYRSLGRGIGLLGRRGLGREASHLYAVTLEVGELVERADTAIKFLSDMYSARLYRLAAAKIGVPDYKNLVSQKLATARDLYRFMVDESHQARAFILELTIVIILIIDLIALFGGIR